MRVTSRGHWRRQRIGGLRSRAGPLDAAKNFHDADFCQRVCLTGWLLRRHGRHGRRQKPIEWMKTLEECGLHVSVRRRAGTFCFLQPLGGPLNIRVISSFTDDDEDRFAPVLLKALADLLTAMPITYSVRVETTRGKTLHRSRTAPETPPSTLSDEKARIQEPKPGARGARTGRPPQLTDASASRSASGPPVPRASGDVDRDPTAADCRPAT
jgi:hypothetical protein